MCRRKSSPCVGAPLQAPLPKMLLPLLLLVSYRTLALDFGPGRGRFVRRFATVVPRAVTRLVASLRPRGRRDESISLSPVERLHKIAPRLPPILRGGLMLNEDILRTVFAYDDSASEAGPRASRRWRRCGAGRNSTSTVSPCLRLGVSPACSPRRGRQHQQQGHALRRRHRRSPLGPPTPPRKLEESNDLGHQRVLELGRLLRRSFQNSFGQPREPRDVDAEALGRAALGQLVEEDDVLSPISDEAVHVPQLH